MAASLLLASCYSNTRPKEIGRAAPNSTVRDSERRVSLSQLGTDSSVELLGELVPTMYRGDTFARKHAETIAAKGRRRVGDQRGRRRRRIPPLPQELRC
jgi:hypothetical protein